MTWVITLPGLPSGAIILTDVRVSFRERSTGKPLGHVDGVQKVHRVASNLVVGFAGSVPAGFVVVDLVRSMLHVPDPDAGYWSPAKVALALSRRLPRAWADLDPAIRDGGCELLLVGAWPSQHKPFPHSDAYRLAAPTFHVEQLPRGRASAIGSGSEVPKYKEMLDTFETDWGQLAQFSTGFPGRCRRAYRDRAGKADP